MSQRGVRRYVADLLRGRRPRSFHAHDDDVAQVRAAIMLRAARPGSGAPREEFVTALHRRLAAQQDLERGTQASPEPRAGVVDGTRRGLVAAASIAAAAAAVGAGIDHVITTGAQGMARDTEGATQQTLTPSIGAWRTVAASADLAEGAVLGFDLGSVIGFVARTSGHVAAVSGVCTHLGCRLALDAATRALNCPCHSTSFAVNGELLHYQLAVAPRALPRFAVREVEGTVQIYAPPGSV